jgi:ATP/maltotriose-dependent transcriptional regulator MalT
MAAVQPGRKLRIFGVTPFRKSHVYSIYQKLNVNGRQQAVDKAGALGMLSSR